MENGDYKMITKKEIIYSMSLQEITFKTLFNQMKRFVEISESEIHDIIAFGCKNVYFKAHIAYILGLKKHLRKGFVPKEVIRIISPRQLSMDITHKPTAKTKATGALHFNAIQKNTPLHQRNSENISLIKRIVEALGGTDEVSKRMFCTQRVVRNWNVKKEGVIYIPPRYINHLMLVIKEAGLPILKEDLVEMLPEEKKDQCL